MIVITISLCKWLVSISHCWIEWLFDSLSFLGYKYIRLYPPSATPYVSPLQGRMKNNSAIDFTDPLWYEQYPEARELPYEEYILGPGDSLYLPKWYWHFIQAIDRETASEWFQYNSLNNRVADKEEYVKDADIEYSFSVSFWWGKRCEPM